MQWLTNQQRAGLLADYHRDAFHLEMRDLYNVEDELEPLRKWRAGEWHDPDAADWWEPWLAKVRQATVAGRTVRRLRIVTEPITEYTRFLWDGTRYNVSAGEDVRWLPRQRLPNSVDLPDQDFWLLDDTRLIFNHFDDTRRSMRMEEVTDANLAHRCARLRDQLWPLAVRHGDYRPT